MHRPPYPLTRGATQAHRAHGQRHGQAPTTSAQGHGASTYPREVYCLSVLDPLKRRHARHLSCTLVARLGQSVTENTPPDRTPAITPAWSNKLHQTSPSLGHRDTRTTDPAVRISHSQALPTDGMLRPQATTTDKGAQCMGAWSLGISACIAVCAASRAHGRQLCSPSESMLTQRGHAHPARARPM